MRLAPALAYASLVAAVLIPAAASTQPAGPTRKPGLWSITMDMAAPMAMHQALQMCTDATTETGNRSLINTMSPTSNCAAGPMSVAGGRWSYSSNCKVGTMTMMTTGVASGDFTSGYHIDSTTTTTPAPIPSMAQTHMTIDARWVGPCPASLAPGEAMMNGKKITIPK